MNESAPIAQLEVLLNEFYHSSTSNFRRQEIDRILKNFQNSESSYKLLIENLASGFNNQYLWFFSVSTIEVSIEMSIYSSNFITCACFQPFSDNYNKKMEYFGYQLKKYDSFLPLACLQFVPF